MNKFSSQTTSFIVLALLVLVGTAVAVNLASRLQNSSFGYSEEFNYQVITHNAPNQNQQKTASANVTQPQLPPVDTSGWKLYQDTKYNFSFKYDPSWKQKSVTNKKGMYIVVLDPGTRYDNIRIYVTKDNFFAMGGLNTTHQTIAGMDALNANNELFGIKNGANYFTFDLGMSLRLKPQFNALMKTLAFR